MATPLHLVTTCPSPPVTIYRISEELVCPRSKLLPLAEAHARVTAGHAVERREQRVHEARRLRVEVFDPAIFERRSSSGTAAPPASSPPGVRVPVGERRGARVTPSYAPSRYTWRLRSLSPEVPVDPSSNRLAWVATLVLSCTCRPPPPTSVSSGRVGNRERQLGADLQSLSAAVVAPGAAVPGSVR